MSIVALSDLLGIEVIGDVPIIRNIKGEFVNEYLENENTLNKTNFFAKSTLIESSNKYFSSFSMDD